MPFDDNIILLKMNESNFNSLLMNVDINDDGIREYCHDLFADKIADNLEEYVFGHNAPTGTHRQIIKEAAESVLKINEVKQLKKYFDEEIDESQWEQSLLNKYCKKGFFGEIILHYLMKELYQTIPLVSKVYFKDSVTNEALGFDAVHVKDKTMVLGESKFYGVSSGGKEAIKDLIDDCNKHLRIDYLNDQFLFIKRKVGVGSYSEKDNIISQICNAQRLQDKFDMIQISLMCMYESANIKKIKEVLEDEFQVLYFDEIQSMKSFFDEKNNFPNKNNVQIVLTIFPIDSKKKIVKNILEKIYHMQKV